VLPAEYGRRNRIFNPADAGLARQQEKHVVTPGLTRHLRIQRHGRGARPQVTTFAFDQAFFAASR
jgi:hypothetical protein